MSSSAESQNATILVIDDNEANRALAQSALEDEGYRVTLDANELADCSKVVATSTLLLNDTLDHMLACCRNARWFAMIGPSAGCLPDALFASGVTLLGGSWINERDEFTAALRSGESLGDYANKFALTVDSYPGFDALLARASGAGTARAGISTPSARVGR